MRARCSRAMAGVLSAATLEGRLDENGTDFLAAATAAGYGGTSTQVRAALRQMQHVYYRAAV